MRTSLVPVLGVLSCLGVLALCAFGASKGDLPDRDSTFVVAVLALLFLNGAVAYQEERIMLGECEGDSYWVNRLEVIVPCSNGLLVLSLLTLIYKVSTFLGV